MTENRAIGKDNQLLYRLKGDLRRFKQLTIGKTVIMGRKTFESLPNGALPNRRNIVLSRAKGLTLPNAEVFSSLGEALDTCDLSDDVFVIGGADIYKEAMPIADRMIITFIEDIRKDADTFFPDIEEFDWVCDYKSRVYNDNGVSYINVVYVKRTHPWTEDI